MNIAVCGGDERSARLCGLLSEDGHRVRAYALDGARMQEGVLKVNCPEGCLEGADAVILPLPASRGEGKLNAPLCPRETLVAEILEKAPEGALICAGKTDTLPEGRYIEDYAAREEFAVGNAALTAEGALELAMAGSDGALWKSRALVLGYGRIGKILAQRLLGMGAGVTVAARRDGDLALAAAMGHNTLRLGDLDGRLGEFDYIFNTVPAPILGTKRLAQIRGGVFMAELASAPGGFDVRRAEELGIRAIYAPGLPGKCAPAAAAKLMREAIYGIIEEWEV